MIWKVLVTYASHVFITNIRKKVFGINILQVNKYSVEIFDTINADTFHSFKFHIEKANNRLNIHGKLSAC